MLQQAPCNTSHVSPSMPHACDFVRTVALRAVSGERCACLFNHGCGGERVTSKCRQENAREASDLSQAKPTSRTPPISLRPTLQLSLSPLFSYYRFRPARHYRSSYGQFACGTRWLQLVQDGH